MQSLFCCGYNCWTEINLFILLGWYFINILSYSKLTLSGTALQERAYAIATKYETIRALFVNLSLESPLESRVEISAVVQKTVINAEIFTLNCFCLGKVAAVASLVMKLDPAEHASYPNFLTSSLDYLLGDITRKVLIGIKKFTEESITLFLASPSG